MVITLEDRAKLISLARQAVVAEVTDTAAPSCENATGLLGAMRGCFVTLTNRAILRGCIGTFHPQMPLGQMIVEMGKSAARDPRFVMNSITPAEICELAVEVSVLSPLEETTEPENLEIGVHGIYIISGQSAGCFLPEVATDQRWTVEEFLSHCCSSKAGMSPDAWRDPDTKVYLFTSEKFES